MHCDTSFQANPFANQYPHVCCQSNVAHKYHFNTFAMKIGLTTAALVLSAAILAPFAVAQDQTITEIVQGSDDFTTLETFLNATGLLEVLDDPDLDATVFAPDDEAFGNVDADTAAKLLTPEWVEHTRCLLTYHVVPGVVLAENLSDGQVVTTLQGENFTIALPPPRIVAIASDADITAVDVPASNGVIHVIDNVLLPTCISSSIVDIAAGIDDFSILVELVIAAGLGDALSGGGPLTVFAPPNAAFEALGAETIAFLKDPANVDFLRATLLYHTYEGNLYATQVPAETLSLTSLQGSTSYFDGVGLNINGVNIASTDILASNGVIHVVDEVILLPSINDLLEELSGYTDGALGFETLIGALDLAGLSSVFDIDDPNNPTQYTLLAPTNAALDPVPELLAKFLQPEWVATHLTAVLLYHVIAGAANSTVVAGLGHGRQRVRRDAEYHGVRWRHYDQHSQRRVRRQHCLQWRYSCD